MPNPISQSHTAALSYLESKKEGLINTINAKVLEYIKTHGSVSNNDIQRDLGITSRQAGSARWHLLQRGVIKVYGTKEDLVTKRTVEVVVWNPFPELVFAKKTDKQKLSEIKELCKTYPCHVITNDIISILNQ